MNSTDMISVKIEYSVHKIHKTGHAIKVDMNFSFKNYTLKLK